MLALQGDVSEHVRALEATGASACEVRTEGQLREVDGLIIPGGESTTVGKLLARFGILAPLRERILAGMPVYGTCTGMILLARNVEDGLEGQPLLATMDIRVRRNGFGRQRESFEAPIDLALPEPGSPRGLPRPDPPSGPFHAVFIRAPMVVDVGPGVQVLGWHGDRIVAVQQADMLATSFHPELTGDVRLHAHFASLCARAETSSSLK